MVNEMKRLSADQSKMFLFSEDSTSTSSALVSSDFTKRSRSPFRADSKAIRLPFGDHTGAASIAASKAKW